MCKYCDGWETRDYYDDKAVDTLQPFDDDYDDCKYSPTRKVLMYKRYRSSCPMIWVFSGHEAVLQINYCPFCGKKLVECSE